MINTIGSTYAGLFPIIQEERPDVWEKMMEMINQMDEIEKEDQKEGFPHL